MENEKELVESVIKGETGDVRRFIEAYQALVAHIVFKLVSNPADREDCCQEIMIKAVHNLPEFRFESKLSTWIAKIAYHRCLNYLQKKKLSLYEDHVYRDDDDEGCAEPFEESISESLWNREPEPDEILNRKNVMEIIYRKIDELPPLYRTILTLYHMDEMSYQEIGQITKLPEGTVKSYLFRARKQLREKLLSITHQEEWTL